MRIHADCLYAKIGLKSLKEYSDADFLGVLRVKRNDLVVFCKQCGPRSDFRSSLIRIHTVCKNRFEKFPRIFSRRYKQMKFLDAGFLGTIVVCFVICL